MATQHLIEHEFEILVSTEEMHIVIVYDLPLRLAILFLSIKYPEKKAVHTRTTEHLHEGIEF